MNLQNEKKQKNKNAKKQGMWDGKEERTLVP